MRDSEETESRFQFTLLHNLSLCIERMELCIYTKLLFLHKKVEKYVFCRQSENICKIR